MGDWYYIGHYGQLGPLTRDQITELIEGEVIDRDTYVWKVGMSEWLAAGRVGELSVHFTSHTAFALPPPPPAPPSPSPVPGPAGYAEPRYGTAPVFASYQQRTLVTLRSDKSRVLAGILQMIIPGVGRMYLGYGALGVLQLVFTLCGGIGWLWSVIDGILMLAGSVKYDGYGRQLGE